MKLPAMRRLTSTLALVLAALSLHGCILVPLVDSVNQMGITSSDRAELLNKDMKRFQEALYWGNPDRALAFATDDGRELIGQKLRAMKKAEKIVDSQVQAVDFAQDAYVANVSVAVKYYSVPFYIVNERTEKQIWKFDLTTGWKIASMDVEDPA